MSMSKLLTKEDVDAVNRLLTWRHETIAEGHEATVEFRISAKGDYVATCLRGSRDEIHQFAYGDTIPEAIDKVLEQTARAVARAVDELDGDRDTEPGHPRPSSIPPVLKAGAVADWSDP